MEIKKVAQAVTGHGNFILYGPSGAGKTFSISTIPGKVLVLAAEKGLRTLVEIAPDIDVAEIDTMDGVREAFEYLRDSGHGYEVVVIDSLSELADLALAEAKKISKDGRQHYMAMSDSISGMIRSFNSLPLTVVYTAQEERVNQEDLGLLDYVYAPAIPGRKFAARVPYKFDFVFCLRARMNDEGEIERRFQTGMHGDYLAKSRSQRLEIFELPDWKHIFGKLGGHAHG